MSQPQSLLSTTDHQHFDKHGYLVLERYASNTLVDALKSAMHNLLTQFEPAAHQSAFVGNNEATDDAYFLASGSRIHFFLEPDALDNSGRWRQDKALSVNKVGHALHHKDPAFAGATQALNIPQLSRELGHQQPRPLQSMYLFKQPRIGAPVALHQDATFLYTEPCSVVGFWLALDDATVDNGCLWALPGGHRLGLKRRMRRVGQTTRMEILDDRPFPEDTLTPLPVPAGSLVLLHGLLPHLSYANQSGHPRHAYSLHVIDDATRYPDDNWLQPELNPTGPLSL